MRSNARKSTAKARNGTKLAKIVRLLTRPQGCTSADALKVTGWPSLSFNQKAKAAGLRLKKKKEGRINRYWAA